ncbi:type I-E CRISPR-associated protein Cse1/CasA [uncultured Rothia sp.]|uniref:type I-E CRISPR-associated protein Cse1/CasA n=1 Tax=uncultured Rothia sp. TaxID=316088 RepID=UPI0032168459
MSESVIPPSFNLVEEPWIPCLMDGGTQQFLSLQETFQQAYQVRRIAGDSPQQDYAVLRVLLVILWRAYFEEAIDENDPQQWWSDLFEQVGEEEFYQPILAYLQEWKDSFDLLHPKKPFMQASTLETSKGEHVGVQRLVPEAEQDYFTLRAGEGRESLSFAEATRWLITLQAWDYSGIKPGALGDPRVKGGKGYPIGTGWAGNTGGIVIHGENLGQTLLLNTVPDLVFNEGYESDSDLPAWEREPQTASPRSTEMPTGPCDVLTWQSRRVRLFARNNRVDGVLVTNGDKIEIRNQYADPMTAYRYSKAQSKKGAPPVFFAKAHSEERTLWRGVSALLIQESREPNAKGEFSDKKVATLAHLSSLKDVGLGIDQRIDVELIGFVYGPKASIITDSIHEVVPFKASLLLHESSQSHYIVSAAQQAVAAAINLGQFAGFLKEAAGKNYEFVPDATESVLHELETSFKEWVLSITPETDGEKARNEWFDVVAQAIEEHAAILARGAGPKALIGRMADGDSGQQPKLLSTATALGRLRNSLKKTLERSEENHD